MPNDHSYTKELHLGVATAMPGTSTATQTPSPPNGTQPTSPATAQPAPSILPALGCTIREGDRITLALDDVLVYVEVLRIRPRDFPTKGKLPEDPAILGCMP